VAGDDAADARSHYDGSVTVLTTPEVDAEETADRSRFQPLSALTPFRHDVIRRLAARPDRAQFNLPNQLHDLAAVEEQPAYLPAYLVETTGEVFAYTGVGDSRDPFLENLCRRVPAVKNTLDAEESAIPREIWLAWLAERGFARGTLRQLPNGVWRATLPASAFGSAPGLLPPSRVGSFELRRRHFAQLWCDRGELRRKVACERALGMAQRRGTTRSEFLQRLETLAQLLEIDIPTVAHIRRHAKNTNQHDRLAMLDSLE
jgi:hypothetical protein